MTFAATRAIIAVGALGAFDADLTPERTNIHTPKTLGQFTGRWSSSRFYWERCDWLRREAWAGHGTAADLERIDAAEMKRARKRARP